MVHGDDKELRAGQEARLVLATGIKLLHKSNQLLDVGANLIVTGEKESITTSLAASRMRLLTSEGNFCE